MKTRIVVFFLSMLVGGWAFWSMTQPITAQGDPDVSALKRRFWLAQANMDVRLTQMAAQEGRGPESPQISDAKTYPFGYASLMAFQSFLDGDWNIFLSNGNYEKLWRLTNNPNSDASPRLTTAGDRVVFTSNRTGNWDIYTRSVDGSNLEQLTIDGRDEIYPAWSPDGRKICYAKKTGDNYQIYLMDADGSGQRVLTYPGGASDVDPDWSSDGKQIAFVRRGDGGYGSLMVMDADGGHVRSLASGLRYLQNPRWSPDGRQIGFDYDADDDDWNELAVIDVATGQIRVIQDFRQRFVDSWFGDWTEEGDYLIAVKAIYEVRDNRLYLKNTRLFMSHSEHSLWDIYGDSWVDLAPDWRYVDREPPQSSMQPLPPVSPAYFDVSWSGEDVGIAGLAYFEVQKKEGNGPWESWERTLATSAEFYGGGKAGKTFYFRMRAVDRAGNAEPWPPTYQTKTTIETLPPVVTFDPIPLMLRKCEMISWQAKDRGGSGVSIYHFQLREADAAVWKDQGAPNSPTRRICEDAGQMYAFRIRAKDLAGNWSAWVYSHLVTLYQWKIDGRGTDNREHPLPVDVTISPPAFQSDSRPDDGHYAGYTADASDAYAVTFQSPGYLPLPQTIFPARDDATLDVAFPPADNLIPDWGFEGEGLEEGWQVQGQAVITDTQRHTGRQALLLGERIRFEQEPLWAGVAGKLAMTPQGEIHLTFPGGASGGDGYELYYANRSPHGQWSSLKNISHNPLDTLLFEMQLDARRNRLHLAWGDVTWYYTARSEDGTWSPTESIPLPSHYSTLYYTSSFLDDQGNFYLAYIIRASDGWDLYLSIRSPAGVWKTERVAQDISTERAYSMVVEPQGAVHAVWFHEANIASHIFYRYRDATGQWHDSIQLDYPLTISDHRLSLTRDKGGMLHLFWVCTNADTGASRFCYAQRDAQGVWSEAQTLLDLDKQWLRSWIVRSDRLNRIHLLLYIGGKDLRYRLRRADGSWTPDVVVDPLLGDPDMDSMDRRMEVDARGQAHILWNRKSRTGDTGYELFYTRVVEGDRKALPIRIGLGIYPSVVVSDDGAAHFVAKNPTGSNLFYARDHLVTQDWRDALVRDVTIPADAIAPTLSFFYNGSQFDRMTVRVGDERFPLAPDGEGGAWRHRWIDLTPWRGRTTTLQFEVQQRAGTLPVWVNLDEITVGSGAFPDLWVTAPAAAFPSRQPYTLTLAYGNANAEAPARNVVLTATLPANVRLVEAMPPAQVQGDALTWSWPELAAGARGEIRLTVQVDAPRAVRVIPLRIASSTHEPRQTNNEAQTVLFADGYTQILSYIAK